MSMMRFDSLTVFIQYAFDAGNKLPSNKSLMARVMQNQSDGIVYGANLLSQYVVTIDTAIEICRKALRPYTREILFTFDQLLKRKPETVLTDPPLEILTRKPRNHFIVV